MNYDDPNGEGSVYWCQRTFTMLAVNGIWAVPRSSLIFEKKWDPPRLELVTLPVLLTPYQEEDFQLIKRYFAAAGILVTKGGERMSETMESGSNILTATYVVESNITQEQAKELIRANAPQGFSLQDVNLQNEESWRKENH